MQPPLDSRLTWTVAIQLVGWLAAVGLIVGSGGACHAESGPFALATLNATLNALSAIAIVSGFVWIARGNTRNHRLSMLTALGLSALFLATYVAYHLQVGHVKYVGQGAMRTFYFSILLPHIVLAAVALPLILVTTYHALKGQWEAHRTWAVRTLPVWLFVSLSGVIVYLLLYGT